MQLRREVIQPAGKQRAGLLHQPGLNGALDLRGRSVIGKAEVQGLRGVSPGQRNMQSTLRRAAAEHQPDRRAQISKDSAVFPDNARSVKPAATFMRFLQFFQYPAGLSLHGQVNFIQRHPLRCADRQPFSAYGKTDGATFSALDFKRHGLAVQQDFTRGAWVAKSGGRQRRNRRYVFYSCLRTCRLHKRYFFH